MKSKNVIGLISILLMFNIPAISEDYMPEKNNTTQLEIILSNCEEAKADQLDNILSSDVFNYFELEEEYDTPLKKKVFMKSEEFKEKEKELNLIKVNAKNTVYYYSMTMDSGAQYDTDRGGFIIPMNYVQMTSALTDNEIKYNFIGLPVKIYNFGQYGKIVNQNCIFLKMNEEDALKIENDIQSIKVYILFNAEGVTDIKVADSFVDVSPYSVEATSYNITQVIKCKVLNLIIANHSTGEIYFSYKK